MSDDDSAQDVAFGSKADQLAAGQGLAQGAADSDIYVGDKDYGGDVSKTMFVPGSIALGAGALGKAMGQGHPYGGPGPYYGGAEGYGAAKQGIVIDGGSFITETYDDGASDGVVKAGMGSDNLAAGQGLAQGAQGADALVAGGKKGGKMSKTVFQPGQTVLGAGVGAGSAYDHAYPHGYFGGMHGAAGHAAADSGIVIQGGAYETITMSDDDSAQDVAFGSKADQLAAIFGKAASSSKSGLSAKPKASKGGYSKNQFSLGGLTIGAGVIGGGQSMFDGFSPFTGYPGQSMSSGVADTGLLLSGDSFKSLLADDSSSSSDIALRSKSSSGAIERALGGTDNALSFISEASICIDASGRERCFGDSWIDFSDECSSCTCTDVGKISCSVKECPAKPLKKEGFRIVESSKDACCINYMQVPTECDTSSCPYTVPTCQIYEELATYSLDDCCSTYECKCNPSLCPKLGSPPCPVGCVRIVMDSDECCPVGKCVKNVETDLFAGMEKHINMEPQGLLHSIQTEDDKDASVTLSSKIGSAAQGSAASGANSLSALKIITEAAMCIDYQGKERNYGDTWFQHSETCQLCSCADNADVRCETRNCDPYPVAPEGFVIVEEKADECCYNYRVVAAECEVLNCPYKATICEYYEDLVTYPIDECCCTYECKCNTAKCSKLGNPTCPHGTERMVIEDDACCPVGKCVEIKLEMEAQADSNVGYAANAMTHRIEETGGEENGFGLNNYLENNALTHVYGESTQGADALVAGGKVGGKVSKTVFQPGQTVLGAGAAAGAGHEQAYPYGYFGGKHGAAGHAAADSGIVIQGGAYETITMSDDDSAQDVAFGSKADQLAAGQGLAQGAADSDIYVGDKDYGGDVSKTMFVPGSIALGAGALGKAMGQGHPYGGPGPYYGGAEGYGAAKQGIVIDGGSFITETYDDGASDGVVKAGMGSDNLAAGQGLAQGAQGADALVAGGKKGGKVSKTVFQPGQTVLGAGAAAGAGHEQVYPYGYFGGKHGAAGHAAADSGIVIQGGAYETITMSDDDSAQDVAFGSKADQLAAGQGLAQGAADSDIYVGDKDYGGDVSKTMFVPGSIALGAGALGKVMGQGHPYGGPGPYYGGAEGYGAAKQGIVIDGGSFITETYDDGASDGVVKAGMGSDYLAAGQGLAQGAQGADALVAGGKKGGKVSKTVFQPGQTVLGAGAAAGAGHEQAYPYGYFGGKHGAAGHAAADSGIVIQGGAYETITMSDDDSAQDVAFGSKADQLAAGQGLAQGAADSDIYVGDKDYGGDVSKTMFVPGSIALGAGALGKAMGQGHPYGGPGPYYGGAESYGAAKQGIVIDGGSFITETYDDGASDGVVKAGMGSDNLAAGQGLAQGAQGADALVAGGKKGGKVSKTVFQPGQTVLGAGAAAGAGHEQAYPYGYFGGKHGAAGHAAADSGIVIQGGAYETITMSDDDSAQDVAFGSKADQLAAGQGLAQGAADSDIYVGDKDYGGDVSKTMFVPGSIALGAGALGKAMEQGHPYGGPGPYYGGAEGYGAAMQGIVIDGGSFITETYDDGASDGVVKAGMGSDNLAAGQGLAQGAQGADALVAGGKKGGKVSKTVFQPGQTVLGAGAAAGAGHEQAYPYGYFGGKHGAAGHAAADSGIVIQGGAYETITMSDDDSAQDVAFGSKADQLAAGQGLAQG
uniref:uncharacterized protein LOC101242292 n=1 Tax=Ciona intestinalis TaxID=7719 RepID=UPI00089DAEDC